MADNDYNDQSDIARLTTTAVREAGEKIARDGKKKFLKKVVTIIVTKIMAFLAVLVKILPIILGIVLVISIMSWFNIINAQNNQEEYTSTMGQLDITDSTWMADEEDIQNFIDSHFSEDQSLYDALTNKISTIYQWQTDYGYSAYFLLAVVEVDNITSSELDNFLGEMNDKAKSWTSEKYTKVIEIAEDYVGNETAELWANEVQNSMRGLSGQS